MLLFEISNGLVNNFKEDSIKIIQTLQESTDVKIVKLNFSMLKKAFDLYKKYDDKTWSLTDCLSFTIMNENKIKDALTFDKHFQQAGFHTLV